MSEEGFDGADELGTTCAEFADSLFDDGSEGFFTTAEEKNVNLPAIIFVPGSLDVTAFFEAVDQFDGAVVLDGEAFGERANGGEFAVVHAADREKQLILLRLQTLGVGRFVAFPQELADAVA